ncbi:hypothetical protein E2C01_066175 [Portunus trituberculatus]|uniref:Uncharacterized protein n=1 Tax=Portunus trituberculatus TaxID=210409 RepID=A0A5B7HQC1_PORTR|nr:hypothetical protein [Portunus trituberculatus]
MKVSMDRATMNVGVLGTAFMLVFTSFQTQGNMQVRPPLLLIVVSLVHTGGTQR